MEKDTTASNLSIDRMLRIIEVMSEAGRPMRLNEIAEKTNSSASTVMRILNALVKNQYAKQDSDTLLYSLSMKFLIIGTNLRENLTVNQLLRPYLQEITARLNLSCALAVMDSTDDTVVYIDECVSSKQMIRVYHHLGRSYPLHNNACGKLFLSRLSQTALKSYCRTHTFEALTAKSILSESDLENSLDYLRQHGYSLNDEESMISMRCFATPIYNSKKEIVAGISVSGTVSQIPMEQVDYMAKVVRGIVDRFQEEYGALLTDGNVLNL